MISSDGVPEMIHDTIRHFMVGDFFKRISSGSIGWITGLDTNPAGEVVFRVRWAKRPNNEVLCHPALIEVL